MVVAAARVRRERGVAGRGQRPAALLPLPHRRGPRGSRDVSAGGRGPRARRRPRAALRPDGARAAAAARDEQGDGRSAPPPCARPGARALRLRRLDRPRCVPGTRRDRVGRARRRRLRRRPARDRGRCGRRGRLAGGAARAPEDTVIDGQLLAFAGVALVVSVSPGPDMALVLRNTLRGGRTAGFRTVAGIAVGVLASPTTVFTVLKLAGAAYLVYLGVQSLLAIRRGDARVETPKPAGSPFRQGLVTNLLNPKLAVLFTTLLPQFISQDDPAGKSALLAAIFLAIGLTWLVVYTLIVRVVARSRRFRVVTEAITGVVLIGLGARLALER